MAMDRNTTRLVSEGRHLRDYMLHEVPGEATSALNAALQPFDAGKTEPGDSEEVALADAFQAACVAARSKADGYTLREVLAGRSPHIRRHALWITVLLATLAFLLVFLASFWTNWSTHVASVLALHERYDSFDHDTQILKLIELRRHYTTVNAAVEGPDEIEPPKAFLADLAGIEEHYLDEASVTARLDQVYGRAWPHTAMLASLRRMVCPRYPVEGVIERPSFLRSGVWFGCPALPEHLLIRTDETAQKAGSGLAEVGDVEAQIDKVGEWDGGDSPVEAVAPVDEGAAAAGATSKDGPFDAYIVTVEDASEIMHLAGRDRRLLQSYRRLHYAAENRADQLRLRHDLVTQWWLPFVFGALGSVIYCIWRVLSPSHAPLGPLYTLLRMVFAGLAALTLTMLILPSQVLVAGADANRPLVYLVAFVFGYSIEMFIATLNRVNTALAGRLAVREVGDVDRR